VNAVPDEGDAPEQPPERLTGELYVYTEADLGAIAGEAYARVRRLDEIDEERAVEIADMMYELHTGDWMTDE
jgi:hypothetical protein